MKQFYTLLFTFFFFLTSYSQALNFDGVDDYVTMTGTSLQNIRNTFTVEAWVKPGEATKAMHIVSARGGNPEGFDIQIKDGNTIHADIGDGNAWLSTEADATYNYTVDTWFHIAYVVTPTGYKIYVNGNLVGSGNLSGNPSLTIGFNGFTVGSYHLESSYFKGQMSEVRVWSRALSQCEIQHNLNSGLASGQTGLQIYYKLDKDYYDYEARISSVNDSSGNNYNGSPRNFLTSGGIATNYTNYDYPSPVSTNTSIYVPVSAASPQYLSTNATVANLTATGPDLKWYSEQTGGTALAITTPITTGTYYVTQPTAGCEGFRLAVNTIVPPNIISFSTASGIVGTSIVLTGSNFNTTPANNSVFFGATKAIVTAATPTSLTVTIPSGATYGPITVLNTGTNLACYSVNKFNPIYSPAKSAILPTDFATNVDLTTDSLPHSVAIGDLDGDGKPDLVVANSGSNTISVFRNTAASGSVGAGSFAPKIEFATGNDPQSIAIGDLDLDGKLDLVVTNYASNTVSVFRNTTTTGSITTSSFATNVDFVTGSSPKSVAIGDLNGDGKPDLVVANYDSQNVSVLHNATTKGSITTSSFSTKVDFGTNYRPYSVAIGDLDGDNKPDLAVVNSLTDSVSILRNTGISGSVSNSGFANKVDIATGSSPYSVVIGDLDGDGKLDLAIANLNSNSISVYRNTATSGSIGAESFAPKVDFATGSSPRSVAIGDLDGNGKPDLAVVNSISNTISVFRNTATSGSIEAGSFAPKIDFATGNNSQIIVINDLDGDAKPDLVSVNYNSNTVSILRNTANTNLSALTTTASITNPTFAIGTTAYTAFVAKEVATTTVTPSLEDTAATMQLQINGSAYNPITSGTISGALALNVGQNVINIKVTAQNGDTKTYTLTVTRLGNPPVINSFSPANAKPGDTVTLSGINFTTASANNIVFFGATQAIVTSATATSLTVIVPPGATYAPITVLNTETALACYSLTNFNPIYSPAKSTITTTDFETKVNIAVDQYSNSVAIGDLDGDGKSDLVVVNSNSNTISVYRNTATAGSIGSSGSFAPKVDFATGLYPKFVVIGDLDSDGKPDLAITNQSSNTVSILRNTATSGSITTSSFANKVDFAAGSDTNAIAIGDLDGDGKPDLAVTNGSNIVSVLHNRTMSGSITTNSFATKVDFTTATSVYSVAIGDLDGDEKPDLVIGYSSGNKVSVLRNTTTTGTITTSSFASKVDFVTGTPTHIGPISVAIGDLDGDAKPDLAVINSGTNTVSVLRNTAASGNITASSFAAKVEFATGNNPQSIAIGDLDGDGKPDLAVVNSISNTISILRNTATNGAISTSSFATKVDLPIGFYATSIAIGDLDGDGNPEIAALNADDENAYSYSVSVLRNTNNASLSALTISKGTLTPNFSGAITSYTDTVYEANTITVTPTKTDANATITVNGTAVASGTASDIINLSPGSNIITIVVTPQVGTAKTYTINVIRIAAPVINSFSPSSAKPGDTVTLSGIYFNTAPANNIVFFGATRAVVTSATATSLIVTVPPGATYAPITVLNTETTLACYSVNNFNPIYSPAKSTITATDFESKVNIAVDQYSNSVAIGDLDGDGKSDLVVVNSNSNTISVYRNTATAGSISSSGSFAPKVDFATGSNPKFVVIGDLDGDGKPDLAVTNETSNTVSILLNTATSGSITTNSFANKVDFAGGYNAIAIGDLDGDGKPDLAVTNGSNIVSVFHNSATTGAITTNSFAAKVDFITATNVRSITIGDLDNDGKPDLVMGYLSGNVVSVLRNTTTTGTITTSSFASKVDFVTGTPTHVGPISVAIGDLDGDAKPDLAVINSGTNTVSVLRNTATTGSITASSFATKVEFATGNLPQSIAIGDLDGDGKPDLATVNSSSNTISILRNTATNGAISTNSFATKVDLPIGFYATSIAIGDLDGDGKLDLAALNADDENAYNYSVSVLRNTSNNSNLSSLTTTEGTISPSFTKTTTAYTATVPNTTISTTVSPTLDDASASIKVQVNGGGYVTITSGTASDALALNIGSNTIEVKVTAQNGDEKIYKLTVCRGVVPVFTSIAPICEGSSFTLPTTSNNGITGTWLPAINTMATTIYTFTPDANQCADSAMLTVAITASLDHVTTATACDSYTWANNNQVYTTSGIYIGTTTNCVTEKLDLTITLISDHITTQSACGSYLWNGTTYTTSGIYTGTTTNCVTEKLDLTITPISDHITTQSACGSYLWNGTTYTTSGIYTGTTNNCVTEKLDLTIATSTNTTTNASACGSYLWNGTTYTTSGIYTGTTTNCVTEKLDLTITPISDHITTQSACGSYLWNGTTYTTSGIYTGTTTNCVTEKLDLTITPISDHITTQSACGSYLWNGTTYTTSGIYTGTTTNCVTEKLDLTITPNSDNIIQIDACGSYTWNNQTYTQSGIYTGLTNNCVTEKLDLTINNAPLNIITTVSQNNGVLMADQVGIGYQWINCDGTDIVGETNQSYTPTSLGRYAVRLLVACSPPIISNCATLSTDDFSTNSTIKIYPNPSTGIFYLQLPSDRQIEVYNNLGQLILAKKINSGTDKIDLSEKPDGIYFIKIIENGKTNNFKVIKN